MHNSEFDERARMTMLEDPNRPNLCDLCQGITVSQLILPQYYRHAKTRRALRASRATCELCALISYRLGVGRHSSILSPRPNQEVPLRSPCDNTGKIISTGQEPSSTIKLAFVPRFDRQRLNQEHAYPATSVFTEIGIWRYSEYRVSEFHVAVEEGDALGSPGDNSSELQADVFLSGRTIVSNETPSEALFDVVQDWLKTCQQSRDHVASKCTTKFADDQDPPLPTRIIDVGKDGSEPRLVSSVSNQRGRYVALSHCWGGMQPVQTKRQDGSLDRYTKQGIPMASLPKTFYDAVIITRKLGIHYLWIDSLCIIQDDEEDWQRESGRMSTLYWNSTITVSATGARDSTQGCFLPEACGDAVALPSTFSKRGGKPYALRNQYSVRAKDRWQQKVTDGLIMSRAWTLQERWLSGKILHCCAGQWFWECCASKRSQSGFEEEAHPEPRGSRHPFRSWKSASFRSKLDVFKRAFGGVYEIQDSSRAQSAKPLRVDLRPDPDAKEALSQVASVVTERSDGLLHSFLRDILRDQTRYTHWYRDFVSAFSKCNLTKSQDKLPALAGIAAAVHEIVRDTYLAGHWGRDLGSSLLWYAPETTKSASDAEVPSRPATYRAPSWAWASVDGEVKWYPVKGNMDLKIVEATTELVQEDSPFGQVKDGHLVVTGRTASARWDGTSKSWRFPSPTGDWTIDPERDALLGWNILDDNGNDIGTVTFDDVLNTMLPNTGVRANGDEAELKDQRPQNDGYAFNGVERCKVLLTELILLLVGSSPTSGIVGPSPKSMIGTSSYTPIQGPSEDDAAGSTSYALLLSRVSDVADTKFVRVGVAVLYPHSWDDSRWIKDTINII